MLFRPSSRPQTKKPPLCKGRCHPVRRLDDGRVVTFASLTTSLAVKIVQVTIPHRLRRSPLCTRGPLARTISSLTPARRRSNRASGAPHLFTLHPSLFTCRRQKKTAHGGLFLLHQGCEHTQHTSVHSGDEPSAGDTPGNGLAAVLRDLQGGVEVLDDVVDAGCLAEPDTVLKVEK